MSQKRFRYFTVFAEMRTGSNFLEENINQFSDLQGYGELFNPHFIGGAKKEALLSMTLADRDDDPLQMIEAIIAADPDVTPGFRFFNDHDPRILKAALDDPTCGKVILTRNPLDSYVSRKIAGATGQWRLTNLKHQKTAKIDYDHAEFLAHLEATQNFQLLLLSALQSSGQTAFYISYDDIHSLDVLNGLARYLGSTSQAQHIDKKLKKQNPASLEDKVSNFDEMQECLKSVDFLNLNRTPNFEPRRGAGVPGFVAGAQSPLLFLPVAGGPVAEVVDWMAALDGTSTGDLRTGFNQKTLRTWRDENPGFQAFSVVRHPLERAHQAFCSHILSDSAPGFADQRKLILQKFPIPVPKGPDDPDWTKAAHKKAFIEFLKFIKASLAQQTGLRIAPVWASQSAILEAAAAIQIPALIFREAEVASGLALLSAQIGRPCPAVPTAPATGISLAEIYDKRLEALARDAYQRDYQQFGFGNWR